MSTIRLLDSDGIELIDSISPDYGKKVKPRLFFLKRQTSLLEDSFSLETFGRLSQIHWETPPEGKRSFIIARVQTWDHRQPDKAFYSYYNAFHLNKILFQTQVYMKRRLIHRLHVLNPLTNTDIIGDVKYFIVHKKNHTTDFVERKEDKEKKVESSAITPKEILQSAFVDDEEVLSDSGNIKSVKSPKLETPKCQFNKSHTKTASFDILLLRKNSTALKSELSWTIAGPAVSIAEELEVLGSPDDEIIEPTIPKAIPRKSPGHRKTFSLTPSSLRRSTKELTPSQIENQMQHPTSSKNSKSRSSESLRKEAGNLGKVQSGSITSLPQNYNIHGGRLSRATIHSGCRPRQKSLSTDKSIVVHNFQIGVEEEEEIPSLPRGDLPKRDEVVKSSHRKNSSLQITTKSPDPDFTLKAQRGNVEFVKKHIPSGSITQFSVPVPKEELEDLAPATTLGRRRILSFANSSNGPNGTSFAEWKELLKEDKSCAARFSEGRNHDQVPDATTLKKEASLLGQEQNNIDDSTETQWDAIFCGTDTDFLEQSKFRRIFRENASSPNEAFLFKMPAHTTIDNRRNRSVEGDERNLGDLEESNWCSFCFPSVSAVENSTPFMKIVHRFKCYMLLVIILISVKIFAGKEA